MSEQLNPSLAAERYNRLLMEAKDRIRTQALYGAKQFMQSGYPLGHAPGGTKEEQLEQLKLNHDRNVQILESNSFQGDKVRAQRQLIEEQELMAETGGEYAPQ